MKNNKERRTEQLSVRFTPPEYEVFRKLCHLEFRPGMASVARELVLEWMEKNKKKLK